MHIIGTASHEMLREETSHIQLRHTHTRVNTFSNPAISTLSSVPPLASPALQSLLPSAKTKLQLADPCTVTHRPASIDTIATQLQISSEIAIPPDHLDTSVGNQSTMHPQANTADVTTSNTMCIKIKKEKMAVVAHKGPNKLYYPEKGINSVK
ncbi:hypothetical protein JB92DRAFT_3147780 [Gautieria morchelliformis]|nr:hypothetical protein JB92DRAFT_3147780 [Gautieria morchelliformis]